MTETVNNIDEIIGLADDLYVQHKYEEALTYFEKAADLGNAVAQDMMGTYYRDGLVVDQNYKIAIEYFEKAITKGYSYAFNNLGMMYKQGLGVPKDIGTAICYLEKASKQGLGVASHNLGSIYHFGNEVVRNTHRAAYFYNLALSQNYANATTMNNLAVLYMYGDGVEKDLYKAESLLQRAIELSDSQTIKNNLKDVSEKISKAQKSEKELRTRKILAVICFALSGLILLNIFPTGAVGFCLIGAFVFAFAGIIIYLTMSKEARKIENNVHYNKIKEKQEWEANLIKTCPRCGKHTGHPINETSKKMSVAFWGLASDKIGKTYKCDNCDYMW